MKPFRWVTMKKHNEEKNKKRAVNKVSSKRTYLDAFLTDEQKKFLEDLISITSSLNSGKKQLIERLVQNVLDEKNHDKQIYNVILLRKYLNSFVFSEKFAEELNYIFGLK